MKKITLFFVAISISIAGIFAQNRVAQPLSPSTNDIIPSERTCATMDMISQEELDAFQEWLEPQVQAYLQNQQQSGNPEIVYTIPTVVHVIHNSTEGIGQGRNISNARIQSQINILNADFRKTNSDIGSVPSMFSGIAADSEVNFCLIQTYPTGHPQAGQAMPEPGVDRVSAPTIGGGIANTTTTGYSTSQIDGIIKPATSWNPNQVLNIWVMHLQGGLLGYAQFPNSGNANTDGVVIGYQYFGNNPSASPFHLGRTTTHEVGHYLGLRHIWGDANCGNDFVSDTPTQQTSSSGCPSHPRPTCGNTGDNFQNYMDYTNDACMFMFTNGQKAVMQNVLATASRRSTLNAASAILCAAAPLTANFTANNTTITAGQTVTFTNTSGGPNPITSNSWNFDVTSQGGVTPSTSSVASPGAITYNTAGTYTVSLLVGDGTSTDSEVKNGYITVLAAGSQVCDSTAATWDFAMHGAQTGAFTWGPDCNGTAPSGYILGQNCYNDNGWADKVPYTGSGTFLTDVIYYFSSSGTGNVNLKVWGVNAGAPGNVLAQQTVQISQLGNGGTPTLWSLASPASLNGNFFVGHDHTTLVNGDTVALMAAPTGTNTVWAKETGGWANLSVYNLDHSGAVIPVICNSIITGEKEILGQIDEILVFPNPSNGTINIALTEKKETTIEIYNIVGKLIYTSGNPLNTQFFTVDINNQPSGIYFVNIKTGNTITTKKLMLSK